MKIRLITAKQFRQNLTRLAVEAQQQQIEFIVMNHSTPILRVQPMDKKDVDFFDHSKEMRRLKSEQKNREIVQNLRLIFEEQKKILQRTGRKTMLDVSADVAP